MNIEEIQKQIIKNNPKLFPKEAKQRRRKRLMNFFVTLCLMSIILIIMFTLVILVSPDKERKNVLNVMGYADGCIDAIGGDSENIGIASETETAEASLVMPVSGNISSGFGERENPFDGDEEFHKGTDFAAPMKTPIYAAADGIVTRSENNVYAGNFIELEHSNGIKTRYLHCSELLVNAGDTVKAGDNIALVGSTGNSTGPHLHFEVHINGMAVDPMTMLDD